MSNRALPEDGSSHSRGQGKLGECSNDQARVTEQVHGGLGHPSRRACPNLQPTCWQKQNPKLLEAWTLSGTGHPGQAGNVCLVRPLSSTGLPESRNRSDLFTPESIVWLGPRIKPSDWEQVCSKSCWDRICRGRWGYDSCCGRNSQRYNR